MYTVKCCIIDMWNENHQTFEVTPRMKKLKFSGCKVSIEIAPSSVHGSRVTESTTSLAGPQSIT